jgi:tetratricopeptide (TPR) repeat protein
LAVLPVPASADEDTVNAIHLLLDDLVFDQADVAVSAYEILNPTDSDSFFLRSRLLFLNGDYAQALEYAEQAMNVADEPSVQLQVHRNRVEATVRETEGFASHRTSGGHFIIRYDASRDGILIPFADETLERAYAAIGADFDYFPAEPVRVEFYPTARSLAAVSPLTEEAIRNSGTIALCKYNRLMVTSPRALVRGYTWRDTLSHEYVHLVIQHLTGSRVPIWLHEGLAKFEEQRWRGDEHVLPVANQDQLGRRVAEDNLVSFEQMHPSMALLPNQGDSATAFAEVYTAIEFLVEQHGIDGMRDLVWAIRDGAEVEDAIEQITGLPLDEWVDSWDAYMRARPYEQLPSDFVNSLQFMPTNAQDAPPDDLADIANEEARNFIHLGQLLRARDRIGAAIVEYRKAESLVGSGNPAWQNYLARALLDTGRMQEAIEALGEAAYYYPGYYLSMLHLGEAYNRTGQPDRAVEYLTRAVGVNPFDPNLVRQLMMAYEASGDTEAAAQLRSFVTQ